MSMVVRRNTMTNIELNCCVRVDIKADYYMVEPKSLEQAIKEYARFNVSEKGFTMSEDKLLLKYETTERIEFDSFADMVANLEKRIVGILESRLWVVDNWNVLYHITRIEGYDSWGQEITMQRNFDLELVGFNGFYDTALGDFLDDQVDYALE